MTRWMGIKFRPLLGWSLTAVEEPEGDLDVQVPSSFSLKSDPCWAGLCRIFTGIGELTRI